MVAAQKFVFARFGRDLVHLLQKTKKRWWADFNYTFYLFVGWVKRLYNRICMQWNHSIRPMQNLGYLKFYNVIFLM